MGIYPDYNNIYGISIHYYDSNEDTILIYKKLFENMEEFLNNKEEIFQNINKIDTNKDYNLLAYLEYSDTYGFGTSKTWFNIDVNFLVKYL